MGSQSTAYPESILFDIWKIVWVPHNLWKWNPSLLLYRKVRTRLNDYELVVEENHSRDAMEWNGNIAYLFFARTLYFIHCEKNKATKTNNKPTMITIGLILRPAFGQRKRLRNFFASSEPWQSFFFAPSVYFIHCGKNKATKTNNKPTMITIGLMLRRACGQRKRLRNFFPQVHLVPLCSLGDPLSSSSDTSSIGSPWRSPLRPSESNRSRAIFLALFHSRKSCSFASSKVLFTVSDSCWFSWVDTTASRGIPWESACAGDPLLSSSETPSIKNKNNYMYLKECPWSTTTNRKTHKNNVETHFFFSMINSKSTNETHLP